MKDLTRNINDVKAPLCHTWLAEVFARGNECTRRSLTSCSADFYEIIG